MSDLLLTEAEIQSLTGRTQYAAQMRWLAKSGWRFERGADGKPKVSRAQFLKRQGVSAPPPVPSPDHSWMG